MNQPFVTPVDVICNALLQNVMDKEVDARFTLKELIQGNWLISPAVYKQMYEQLLIRDLAYVGEIDDNMNLEDMVWYRQDSNGMYELYKACK